MLTPTVKSFAETKFTVILPAPNSLILSNGDTLSNIDRILEGSLRIRQHYEADPKVAPRSGAIEIAMQARDMGMQGMELKSHEYLTQPVDATTNELVPELTILWGIALDEEAEWLTLSS